MTNTPLGAASRLPENNEPADASRFRPVHLATQGFATAPDNPAAFNRNLLYPVPSTTGLFNPGLQRGYRALRILISFDGFTG